MRIGLTYTVDCVGTNAGWRYRVTVWCGRVAYTGQRTYERHQDAERAAKATGATERAPSTPQPADPPTIHP